MHSHICGDWDSNVDIKRKLIYHYLADLGIYNEINAQMVEPYYELFNTIDVKTLESIISKTKEYDFRGLDISVLCNNDFRGDMTVLGDDPIEYNIEYFRCQTFRVEKDDKNVIDIPVITDHLGSYKDGIRLHRSVDIDKKSMAYWYTSNINDGQHRSHNLISPLIIKNGTDIRIDYRVDCRSVSPSAWSRNTKNAASKTWKLYNDVLVRAN